MRFVAVGDAMVDAVSDQLPSAAQSAHATVRRRAGGSTVNALVGRALGAEVKVVGRVGSDAAGDLIVSALEARGIAAHLACDDELPPGVAVALADAVVASRGADVHLSPDDLPSPLRGDALLVSGFALFQEVIADLGAVLVD